MLLNFSNEDATDENDGRACKVRSITLVSYFATGRHLDADTADKLAGQKRRELLLVRSTNEGKNSAEMLARELLASIGGKLSIGEISIGRESGDSTETLAVESVTANSFHPLDIDRIRGPRRGLR